MFHEFFHILPDTSGRHATPRDTMWLRLLKFPNGVSSLERVAKVEVVSVLGFACVLLPYSCSALHSYTRKRISFPAPTGDDGSVLRGRFSL